MLKLGSLGQQIGQLLAVPHHDGRLAHKGTLPLAMAVLKRLDAVAAAGGCGQTSHCSGMHRPVTAPLTGGPLSRAIQTTGQPHPQRVFPTAGTSPRSHV